MDFDQSVGSPGASSSTSSNPSTWVCGACTFENADRSYRCVMCHGSRGSATRKAGRVDPAMQSAQKKQEQLLKMKLAKKRPYQRRSTSGVTPAMTKTKKSYSGSKSGSPVSPTPSSSYATTSDDNSNMSEMMMTTTKDSDANSTTTTTTEPIVKPKRKYTRRSAPPTTTTANNKKKNIIKNGDLLGPKSGKVKKAKGAMKKLMHPTLIRLTNVDRDNVQVTEVTVNGITVVISEFPAMKTVAV